MIVESEWGTVIVLVSLIAWIAISLVISWVDDTWDGH